MPTRENLFQLIKLLSADEKKYFVKTLGKHDHSDPVLLHLFKDLSKARSYQPDKLGKKYKSLRVLLSKLKRELLEAMRVKRLDKDIDNQIFCHLKDYQFFYEKGFLKSATKALEEAKKLSVAYEKTGTTLQIVREEIRLRMEQGTRGLQELIGELIEEKKALVSLLMDEEDAISTHYSLFAQFRANGKGSSGSQIPFPSISNEKTSFFTKSYRHNANAIYSRLIGDISESRRHYQRLVNEWRSQKYVQKEKGGIYQKILGNYATLSVAQGDFEEGLVAVEELERLPRENFNEAAESFQAVALVRLLWALNADPEIQLDELLSELDKGLKKYDPKINPARKIALWYNMFLLCLFKKDHSRAYYWMDQILKHKKQKVMKFHFHGTRLLKLFLEYDQAQFDILENSLNATYVLFHREGLLDDFSNASFRFFRAILKDVNANHRECFNEFEKELGRLQKLDFKPSISAFDAVVKWVKERKQG